MLDPRLSLQNDKEGKGERESLVLRLASLRPKVDTCTLNSIVPLEQRDDINNDYVHAWLNLHIEEYYGLYGLFYVSKLEAESANFSPSNRVTPSTHFHTGHQTSPIFFHAPP